MTVDTEQLIDRIYDAALQPAAWEAVLAGVADSVQAAGGILIGTSIRDDIVFSAFECRTDPECQRIFAERHVQNSWSLAMLDQPVGKIVTSDEILPARELVRTEFWADVLKPQGFVHNAMASLANRPGFVAAFNILRGPDKGPFEADERRRLATLAPHLTRSVELSLRADAYRALQRAELSILDGLPHGVVVLDRGGRILQANRAARRLLGRDGAFMTWDSLLVPRGRTNRKAFDQIVGEAIRGGPGGSVFLDAQDGDRVAATVVPLRGSITQTLRGEGLDDPVALVMLAVDRPTVPLGPVLSQIFDLTRAEADVASHLASGASVPTIARALGLSINTVKTHARRIFGKAEVSGQAAFVRATALLRLQSSADDPAG